MSTTRWEDARPGQVRAQRGREDGREGRGAGGASLGLRLVLILSEVYCTTTRTACIALMMHASNERKQIRVSSWTARKMTSLDEGFVVCEILSSSIRDHSLSSIHIPSHHSSSIAETMLRRPLLSSALGPLRARPITSPRIPLFPIRTLITHPSPRVPASFFRAHTHSRPPSRSVSIHIIPQAWAARHRYLAISARLVISSALGLGILLGAILFHDAFTYSDRHIERVPMNTLVIQPKVGGKKELPILEVNLDAEDPKKKGMQGKPRLVIIGGGWGVSGLLRSLMTWDS